MIITIIIVIISLSFQSTTRVCKMACRSKSFGRSSSYSDEICREKFSTCNLWFFEKCPGKMPARCCWVKDRKNKSFASWSFTDITHAKKKRHPLFLLVGIFHSQVQNKVAVVTPISCAISPASLLQTWDTQLSLFSAVLVVCSGSSGSFTPTIFVWGHSLFQAFKH